MLRGILGAGLCAALAACYSPPEPDCGFTCGPSNTCPTDYACASDHICHRNGFSGTCPARSADAGTDAAAFAVVSTDPVDGATGVPVDQVIIANVDRDVDGANGPVLLVTGRDPTTGVDATESYSLGSFRIRIVPALQLAPNTTYEIMIGGGGITEHNGTAVLTLTHWTFTTGTDTVAPHLASSMPFNGQANVPTTATVTLAFDEPVMGVDTTSVTVTDGVTPVVGAISATDTHTYVFTPTAALTAATTYTVSLTNAITDDYSNALAPVSFTFTTQ